MLANAELQAENQTFEVVSRSQAVLAHLDPVCFRAKDLRARPGLQQADQEGRRRGVHDLSVCSWESASIERKIGPK